MQPMTGRHGYATRLMECGGSDAALDDELIYGYQMADNTYGAR